MDHPGHEAHREPVIDAAEVQQSRGESTESSSVVHSAHAEQDNQRTAIAAEFHIPGAFPASVTHESTEGTVHHAGEEPTPVTYESNNGMAPTAQPITDLPQVPMEVDEADNDNDSGFGGSDAFVSVIQSPSSLAS